MKLKVHRESFGMCGSCRRASIVHHDNNDAWVYCNLFESRIRRRVVECNGWDDKAKPALWEMRKTAWILETDESRNSIGFVHAKEWQKRHKYEDITEEQ